MKDKRIRVVQIGTAHDHAADHVDTISALPDDYELVGVCEPNPELKNAALTRISYDGTHRSYEGVTWLTLDEILKRNDYDAAIIETSEADLVPYAKLLADKTLGEPVVKEWIIDHSYTRLYIEFPDAAEEFAAAYG